MFIPDDVNSILSHLNECGYDAYLVGGCVRDGIMSVVPNDYDVATSALPKEVVTSFPYNKTLDVGIKHGTITLFSDIGRQVEVTTFRSDGEYCDNRHPKNVTFVRNIKEDLARRDFTVNAMAYNPQNGLVDCFGSKCDIQNKIIRCVGNPDLRFNEDALRIMRALRFASSLGFTIDKSTGDSIIKNKELLLNVAVERIFEEFKKMIVGKNVFSVMMDYCDVFKVVAPVIFESANTENKYYDSVKKSAESKLDFVGKFALLFSNGNINDPDLAVHCLKNFKSDNNTINKVKFLIENKDVEINHENIKTVINKYGFENTKELIDFQNSNNREDLLQQLKIIKENRQCVCLNDLAINGNDLISLNIVKGKEIGVLLNTVLSMVINDEIPNEKNAILEKVMQIKLEMEK